MNIQLFLEDQEVDLTNDIIFPLNKTFENLSNPTDIVVEYSKSINIPMTQKNNVIMGHIYDIGRTIVNSPDESNTGLYFDPNKRISFRLIHNRSLLLEGYAKFQSANYSTRNKYYTLNLYGALGDVFHKLKEVKLEGDDPAYILNDHCDGSYSIDRNFAFDSFNDDDPTLNISGAHTTDIIGLAPAYRGLYSNFKADQKFRHTSESEFVTFASELREQWKTKYAQDTYGKSYVLLTDAEKQMVDTYVDGLDPEGAIGGGLEDNQYHEYRTYQLRPYIYFNKLMQMYQEKCTELTGYSIELDPYWFNPSNPYWTRSCYMLDFLTADGVETYGKTQISGIGVGYYSSRPANATECSYVLGTIKKGTSTRFDLGSFNLNFHHEATVNDQKRATAVYSGQGGTIDLEYNTYSKYIIRIVAYPLDSNGNWTSSNYVERVYWTSENPFYAQDITTYNPNNFTELKVAHSNEFAEPRSGKVSWVKAKLDSTCVVPASTFNGNLQYGARLVVMVRAFNDTDSGFINLHGTPTKMYSLPELWRNVRITLDSSSNSITYGQTNYISNNVTSLPAKLSNIYRRDDSLFNVILEYTKMFGLVWDVDYDTKKIYLKARGSYFKDYTVKDWGDKLDMSKDYIIEPVVFPSKHIEFNYENTDAYRYKAYREKYDVEYGGKKVATNYDFNTENEKLFSGIHSSISSNRNIVYYTQLLNWDLKTPIAANTDPIERMECASTYNKSEVNVSNWFLRGFNTLTDKLSFDSYVTDDNAYMIEHENYCYYDKTWHYDDDPIVKLQSLPNFSAVYIENLYGGHTSSGILFNQPNEDYTSNKTYTEARGKYIYDLFWDKYINERYNIQNKKLTAYFHLTPDDYFNLKFNMFVVLQGQLFCINKVFDYNMSSNEPTKVELIQVTDPGSYADIRNLYNPIQTSIRNYYKTTSASTGSFNLYVRPITGDATVSISAPASPNTITSEDKEFMSMGWIYYMISWQIPNSGGTIESTITLTSGDFSVEIPVKITRK